MKGNVCAVIMASGHSKRFGRDKLHQVIGGVTLIEHCFQSISEGLFSKAAVVSRDRDVLKLAEQYGFLAVENSDQTDDPAITIRLGVEAVADGASGVVLMVSDQPFFRSAGRLRLFFEEHPQNICAVSANGQRGNPVAFPADLLSELMHLEPGQRGKTIISRHKDRLMLCEIPEIELFDIDTAEDLEQAKKMADAFFDRS